MQRRFLRAKKMSTEKRTNQVQYTFLDGDTRADLSTKEKSFDKVTTETRFSVSTGVFLGHIKTNDQSKEAIWYVDLFLQSLQCSSR